MSRYFAAISLLCGVGWLASVGAGEPPASAVPPGLLLLRNGEVLAGTIHRDGDYYRITLTDGEVRVKIAETALVCHNLDEAYLYKHNRLALGRVDDHLDLADWALRQGLPGYAAKEIAAALAIDPKNPARRFSRPPAATIARHAGRLGQRPARYRSASDHGRRSRSARPRNARRSRRVLYDDDPTAAHEQLRHFGLSRTGLEIDVCADPHSPGSHWQSPAHAAKFAEHDSDARLSECSAKSAIGRGKQAARQHGLGNLRFANGQVSPAIELDCHCYREERGGADLPEQPATVGIGKQLTTKSLEQRGEAGRAAAPSAAAKAATPAEDLRPARPAASNADAQREQVATTS